jgi:hypothetical protein
MELRKIYVEGHAWENGYQEPGRVECQVFADGILYSIPSDGAYQWHCPTAPSPDVIARGRSGMRRLPTEIVENATKLSQAFSSLAVGESIYLTNA